MGSLHVPPPPQRNEMGEMDQELPPPKLSLAMERLIRSRQGFMILKSQFISIDSIFCIISSEGFCL